MLSYHLCPSGNNTFGEDIPKVLCGMKDVAERSQYILMDRVRSPAQKNYIVRAELDKIVPSDVVSELGIFGIVIGWVAINLVLRLFSSLNLQ